MSFATYKEALEVMYDLYKQDIREGYRVLTYIEWLEMYCFNLNEEIKKGIQQ